MWNLRNRGKVELQLDSSLSCSQLSFLDFESRASEAAAVEAKGLSFSVISQNHATFLIEQNFVTL